MTKETIAYVSEQTRALLGAPSCCAELKQAAQAWLDAVGTDAQAEETKKYLTELEEDITSIDGLIAFVSSKGGIAYFGADMAKGILDHAKEIKAKGAQYCDCPACAAAEAILKRKDEML